MAGPGDDPVADVIVVGTGPGGMAAVAAASDQGASVIAVESMGHIGGNAVWSTGYLAFVDSAAQRDAGIEDSEEIFLEDCASIVDGVRERYGIIWDRELTRLFARESARTYEILTAAGVRFTRFIPRPRQHSVDRMLAVEDTWMLQRAYQAAVERPNVRTLFLTSADRLVLEGDRVAGVRARARHLEDPGQEVLGDPFTIRARRGVILATGGFQANPALRRRYQPHHLAATPYLGVDTCRGDGHLMAHAAGGDLINMTYVPPLVIVSSSLVEDAIAVNRLGLRFHDEAGPYEERVEALLAQPERQGYYLFDAAVAERKPHLVSQMPEDAVVAASAHDLAVRIGCEPEVLEESIARWNRFLATDASTDPDFGRVVLPEGRRGLSRPPFSAVPMVIGANFVCGGLNVTNSMQVVDVFGEPIAGLYAAGDCVGGLNPVADLGGIHICGGLTLGRVAGEAAVSDRAAHESAVPRPFGTSMPCSLETRVALVHLAPGADQKAER